MNILYGLYTPDEGEILLNGKPIDLGSTKAAIEHGIGMVHQHFMLIPVMTVAENIVLAIEPTARRGAPRLRRRTQARARALGALRPRGQPGRAHRPHLGRPAAARRDPEGALPRSGDPDPRRADRRPDTAGGEGALRDPRVAEEPGQVDHLHHAQAERGARGRRPDHDAAAWQGRRHRLGRGRDRGRPRADDGRARGAAARRQAAGDAGRAAALGGEPVGDRRPRARGRARRQLGGARRRDPRPRRCRRERPERADRRDRGPALAVVGTHRRRRA